MRDRSRPSLTAEANGPGSIISSSGSKKNWAIRRRTPGRRPFVFASGGRLAQSRPGNETKKPAVEERKARAKERQNRCYRRATGPQLYGTTRTAPSSQHF